ncbi:MAG: hypothetical protein H0U35_04920 [Sporichthyaceae bacterium]|nr:hypothetical protein [Sporichthyaceae bacterium]
MASGERGLDDLRRNEAPGDDVEGHARKKMGLDTDDSTDDGDADDTEGHRRARP